MDLQRTISETVELFRPLEKAISETVIPSILGREISVSDRDVLALPLIEGWVYKTQYLQLTQNTRPLQLLVRSFLSSFSHKNRTHPNLTERQ